MVNGQTINLVRDKDGQLKVADKNQLRLLRTRLTMVFQHFNLWSHTRYWNAVEAPIQVLGLSEQEARERAVKYLAKVGIDERAQGNTRYIFRRSATACFYRAGAGDGTGSFTV